eukprot:6211744-Pleurochrysis_carterae.AAC.3
MCRCFAAPFSKDRRWVSTDYGRLAFFTTMHAFGAAALCFCSWRWRTRTRARTRTVPAVDAHGPRVQPCSLPCPFLLRVDVLIGSKHAYSWFLVLLPPPSNNASHFAATAC